MLAYDDLMKVSSPPQRYTWSDRETMLYALGVGMCSDPMNRAELPFVTENGLKALPTLAAVVAHGAGPTVEQLGIDLLRMLHGEQSVVLHRPMPIAASVIATGRVVEAIDKGDKGAIVVLETILTEAGTGSSLATLTGTLFARDDGGFGGPSTGQSVPHSVPRRPPDLSLDFLTRPDQALIYRLSGDRNPLHSEPEVARRAGFPRPILHGLCTYGITCRAVLQAFANYRPELIRRHQVRFSAPVFPGETLSVDLWRDGDIVSFEAHVRERGSTVIKNGMTVLGG